MSATLAEDEHGNKGGGVLELDLDTDNDAATGGTTKAAYFPDTLLTLK